MFLENIKLALKNFVTSKLRTMLSLLGIMIGVSSVILITTLGNSATANIKNEIASGGMDLVMVYGGWGNARSRKLFSPELGEKLVSEMDQLSASTAVHQIGIEAKSRDKLSGFNLSCINPDYSRVFNIKMGAGRFLSRQDSETRYPAVVLGSAAAKKLFPAGGSVGQSIKILINKNAYHFTIIGVMKKKDATMGASFNDSILLDIGYYRSRIGKIDTVSTFFLKAADATGAAGASDDVKNYLSERTSEKDAFYVESPSSMTKMFGKVTRTLNLVLAAIAGISLLVGGIGIMNIMLVSVTERTREIGIRKALGAGAAVIRGQFLTESAVLTLIGGILGAVFGSLLGKAVTSVMSWTFSPVPAAYALALGFSAVIGIFFGLYPAVRASKLEPIEALSHQ